MENNDIHLARLIHDFIMSTIKPSIVQCVRNRDNCQESMYRFIDELNPNSLYHRQVRIDITVITYHQQRFSAFVLLFMEEDCRELGEFCEGENYNEENYIIS